MSDQLQPAQPRSQEALGDVHDALPIDLPARVQLTAYSPDADRAYALERDRLSQQWREVSADVLAAVVRFDAPGGALDPANLETIRSGLGALRDVARSARSLQPPAEHEGFEAELKTWSATAALRVATIEAALSAADEHAQAIADQAERRAVIAKNKEAGMPWHHGLRRELVIRDDVAAGLDIGLDALAGSRKAMAHVRLESQTRRMTTRPEFSLGESIAAGLESLTKQHEAVASLAASVQMGAR